MEVNSPPVKKAKPHRPQERAFSWHPVDLMFMLKVPEEKAGPGTRVLTAREKHVGVNSAEGKTLPRNYSE